MSVPTDLRYTKDHEWVRVDGDVATVGITQYAADQLGDIVFVEAPQVGRKVAAGEAVGVVESVKAAADLYMPVGGEVVEVNNAVKDHPEAVNTDPHSSWMIKVRVSNPGEAAGLLDSAQYQGLLG